MAGNDLHPSKLCGQGTTPHHNNQSHPAERYHDLITSPPQPRHVISTQNIRISSWEQALGCPRKSEKAQLSSRASPSADRQATPPKILAAESRVIPTFLSPPFVETHPCAIGSSICETRVSPLFNVTSLAIGFGFSQVEGVVFVGLGCRANLCC